MTRGERPRAVSICIPMVMRLMSPISDLPGAPRFCVCRDGWARLGEVPIRNRQCMEVAVRSAVLLMPDRFTCTSRRTREGEVRALTCIR